MQCQSGRTSNILTVLSALLASSWHLFTRVRVVRSPVLLLTLTPDWQGYQVSCTTQVNSSQAHDSSMCELTLVRLACSTQEVCLSEPTGWVRAAVSLCSSAGLHHTRALH